MKIVKCSIFLGISFLTKNVLASGEDKDAIIKMIDDLNQDALMSTPETVSKRDADFEIYQIFQEQLHDFMKDRVGENGVSDGLINNLLSQLSEQTINRKINCRKKGCRVPLTLSGIWNYGCWCNFGKNLLKGQGLPVNEMDAACQSMQLCLRCAVRDAEAAHYACDPATKSFNANFNFAGPKKTSIMGHCEDVNPGDPCAAHVCTCEVQLLNAILELIWSGYTHDPQPKHRRRPKSRDFNYEETCLSVGSAGHTPPVISCCGAYPFRAPYNTFTRSCCARTGDIYSPVESVCCGNSGVIKISDGGCGI